MCLTKDLHAHSKHTVGVGGFNFPAHISQTVKWDRGTVETKRKTFAKGKTMGIIQPCQRGTVENQQMG